MSLSATVFTDRKIKLRYWNFDSKVLDRHRMSLEVHLRRLGQLDVAQVPALEDPGVETSDLLVIGAHLVEEEHFSQWLRSIRKRLLAQGAIWVPVLILSECSFDSLREMLVESIADNWYFDIIAPRHMASLPIRVANLLRIHDHIQELERYAKALEDITSRVQSLEEELKAVTKVKA
jgi:hypothetical protein